jgi:hypothetical protein
MNIPLAPEPDHKSAVFEKDVGTWDAEVEVRPGPGAEPQRSRGITTNKLVAGAWLVSDYQAESGFAGHGIYGFDQTKNKYVGTWVDSMRRFLVIAEGEWNESEKKMTYRGEAQMPDGRKLKWREETTTIDPDTQIFRSFMPLLDGSDFEMMTVKYRRRR